LAAFRFSILFFLIIGSCAPEPPAPPIRFASNAWAGFEPFYIAESLELYPEYAVHITETPRGVTLAQAIRGATIDAAAVSLPRAIRLAQSDVGVTIVLGLDSSEGADAIIARPTITNVSDLKGTVVAADMESASGYLLLRALELNGLTSNDLTIRHESNEALTDGFDREGYEAVATYGVSLTELEKDDIVRIFDSSEIPDEVLDVLVIRNSFLEKQPNRVIDLIEGWLKAGAYVNALSKGDERPEGAIPAEKYEASIVGLKVWSQIDNERLLANDSRALNLLVDRVTKFSSEMGFSNDPLKKPLIDNQYFLKAIKRLEE
jgi:NitT/TauT family transport system substrate-binding protein